MNNNSVNMTTSLICIFDYILKLHTQVVRCGSSQRCETRQASKDGKIIGFRHNQSRVVGLANPILTGERRLGSSFLVAALPRQDRSEEWGVAAAGSQGESGPEGADCWAGRIARAPTSRKENCQPAAGAHRGEKKRMRASPVGR